MRHLFILTLAALFAAACATTDVGNKASDAKASCPVNNHPCARAPWDHH
jgi:hypothetical protein